MVQQSPVDPGCVEFVNDVVSRRIDSRRPCGSHNYHPSIVCEVYITFRQNLESNHQIMLTPPGIRWVLANMPAFCAPMLGFYVIDRFLLRQILEIYLPISLTVAAYSLSFPVLFALRLYVNDLRVYARAKSVGAVFPRTVHAKLPGSLDLIVAVTKEMEHAYPCTY